MISHEQALSKLSKELKISKTLAKKIINNTFGELESIINQLNFTFQQDLREESTARTWFLA